MGPGVGGRQIIGNSCSAGIGVLDNHRSRAVTQVVRQAPSCFGIHQVEVAEPRTASAGHTVEEPGLPPCAVAGAPLVRVLAVAQHLDPVQLQPDHLWQDRLGWLWLGRLRPRLARGDRCLFLWGRLSRRVCRGVEPARNR